jgi:uncharacterized protein
MPIVENSTYQAPFPFRNTHINTIYTSLMRPTPTLPYERERVPTPDDDFIDLDWSKVGSEKLLICVHGLEGHGRKHYVAWMMKRFNAEKYDAVSMNLRGCSGEDNRFLKGYHSGKSDDLDFVVKRVLASGKYKEIVLIGFSVGGNITLKYAGEQGENIPKEVSHVIAFSVPCDILASSHEFNKPKNIIYLNQFLISLKQKARKKAKIFPNQFDLERVLKAKNFFEFDDAYTAPINGFKDSVDYYTKVRSLNVLDKIKPPTLLVNALDDTFLSPNCFPKLLAEKMPNFYLEMPTHGGHLGFMKADTEGYLWTERRAWRFVNSKNKNEFIP